MRSLDQQCLLPSTQNCMGCAPPTSTPCTYSGVISFQLFVAPWNRCTESFRYSVRGADLFWLFRLFPVNIGVPSISVVQFVGLIHLVISFAAVKSR